jgi:small-conductance mechanosensitive channel
MIPNDVSMSTNIENYTERKNRRTEVILQIEYKTPSLKIQK